MNAIIVEKTYNAPIEKVWKAITDKDQMKHWYFDLDEFKPEVGFKFEFTGQGLKGEQYLHLCEVTQVIPQKKLQYSWRYQGFEGNSHVTFELEDLNGKTRLTLTHKGLESFPADNPEFARANFNAGWSELIGKSLQDFLEGK